MLDADLSPSQTRNLEDTTGLAVCDREGVILNVFLRHAKTRRSRIQVEIAQLEYLRPRIRGIGLSMDQQAGGIMGGRGPGETASELLARRLDARLAQLRKSFAKLGRSAEVQRGQREGCTRIALVGYTNAGKTTLMNALTQAGLAARGSLFETLDTTSRCLTRHGGDVLLSDTVGFIRRLPERLLASFESTLAELNEASLLALVVDASDSEFPLHLQTTEELLTKLGADEIPRVYVFNKTDRLPQLPSDSELRAHSHGHDFVALSSRDPEAVARLQKTLLRTVRGAEVSRVLVPYTSREAMALVYSRCRVVATEPADAGLYFTIEAEPHIIRQLERISEEG